MAFDECAPYPADYDYVLNSMKRTNLWAQSCLESMGNGDQALFGIVQGGMHSDLREMSAKELVDMDFDGYALGGLSVGEDRGTRLRVIKETRHFLPDDKPVYLMGVGTPGDIVDAVMSGVDMFDCVIPTRNARNGTLFTSNGKVTIKNARYTDDERPVDEKCRCYTCTHFSRAYLRHLFMAKELLAYRLNTIQIHLPALKSRMSDIRLLVDYFSIVTCTESDKSYVFPSSETIERLCNYNWPGNIEELERMIKKYVTTGDEEVLHQFNKEQTRLPGKQNLL